MESIELYRFLHQLTETMTVIMGLTHLAIQDLPHAAPQRYCLELTQQIVIKTAQELQEQERRLQDSF